jgi:alcohol dehydrogenase class IV
MVTVRSFDRDIARTHIIFGRGTVDRVGEELARLGVDHALVLSTPGRSGLADRIRDELGDAAAGRFAEAVQHTPREITERALARMAELNADSVVAVGGGSTTGLGKAIAVLAGVPHVVLPTTYAGSEVTPVLGETIDGEKVTRSVPEILPDTVIYDAELSRTLPWPITLTSAVNAMAHAVEALYSNDRTTQSDRMAAEAINVLAAGLIELRTEFDSLDAREDLLYGAWLAGTCLGTVGMGLHHKLCHALGGSFGLPHAPTHTVLLPYAMEYNATAAPDVMAKAAAALGVPDAPTGMQSLVKSLGGPTNLAELGFRARQVPEAAELATRRPYPNPPNVTLEGIIDLLGRATAGSPIEPAR